ncbi:MAG TPA: DNA polymerase [Salinimicrobium sp.]|nr:DNA polymerase [Salinimicrobium sp.]
MKVIAIDIETDSSDALSTNILGISFCMEPHKAYYVNLDVPLDQQMEIIERLKPILQDPDTTFIAHNAKFEINVLRRYGINFTGKIVDTMVMHYVLYPHHKTHKLKVLSRQIFNYQQIEFNDIAIGKTKKEKTLKGVDVKVVSDYCCEDGDQTFQFHDFFKVLIEQNNLNSTFELDNQVVPIIADMERYGVLINRTQVEAVKEQLSKDLEKVLEDIHLYIPKDLNINSSKQLSDFLFEKLEIIPIGEKGKAGHYQVSKDVLKQLLPQHPVIASLLSYKAINKVLSTFLPALRKADPTTGRLHASFNQTSTATGRFSSSGPNLQNIPGDLRIRSCFVAQPGWTFIGVDYSNIELRVMAVLSKDAIMIKAYGEGIDLHSFTASQIFGMSMEQITKAQRAVGKTVNFGLIYGMSEFGLSKRLLDQGLDYTVEECKQFINTFFEKYPGVAKFSDELIYQATINGYAQTMFGRKRPLPDINSSDHYKRTAAKRLALNTPIQGSAADILKMAMVKIHNRIKEEKLQSRILLQVHDELLLEVPESEKDYMKEMVRHEMENVVRLPIALEVELKTGKTWADVH